MRMKTMRHAEPIMMMASAMADEGEDMMESDNMKPRVEPMHDSHRAKRSFASTTSVSTGDLAASFSFQLSYLANISSFDPKRMRDKNIESLQHRLLVQKLSLDCKVFTYAVPSLDTRPHLMAWAEYLQKEPISSSSSTTGTQSIIQPPLLQSDKVRLKVQGADIGTTHLDSSVRPGQLLKFNLGPDKTLQIDRSYALPSNQGTEKDKSTWFVKDKKKFRVRTEETVLSVRNTNFQNDELAFVVIAENLPKSTEQDDIQVELLSPGVKEIVALRSQTEGASADPFAGSSHDFLTHVLEAELGFTLGSAATLTPPATPTSSSVHVYLDKISNNLYWALWISAKGPPVQFSYKYRVTHPESMEVDEM